MKGEIQMDNSYFDSLAVVLPEDIEKLKWRGEFDRAVRRIDSRLEKDIPQALRKRLMIEKEILKRMPGQYPYTWAEALGILRDNVRDFKDCELETLWEEDAADWIYVDGEVRFRSSFLKNVLKTRKEYENRAMDLELVRSKAENFALLNRTIASMKERGGAGCRFCIRGTLGILEEAERDGEDIKVYLPLPIEYAQVKNVKIHSVRIGKGKPKHRSIPLRARMPFSAPSASIQNIGRGRNIRWSFPLKTGKHTRTSPMAAWNTAARNASKREPEQMVLQSPWMPGWRSSRPISGLLP